MALRLRLRRCAPCRRGCAALNCASPARLRRALLCFWKSKIMNVTFVLINQGFISLEHHVKKKQENVTCTNLEPVFETPLILQNYHIFLRPRTGSRSRIALAGRGALHITYPQRLCSCAGGSRRSELPIYLDLCLYFGRVFSLSSLNFLVLI